MSIGDGQLVRRAWGGDAAAFGELVVRHRERIERLAFRLVGDAEDAADLTQETLLRAWARLGELRDPEAFEGWLASVARTVCVNWNQQQALRRRLREQQLGPDQPMPSMPVEELMGAEERKRVRELIEALEEPYRETARRHYLQDQTTPQIAAQLGVAAGTIKARLHHARERMRVRRMTQDLYGDVEMPEKRTTTLTPEELARRALAKYDLGDFEALGSVYEPHHSLGIGVQTTRGRYRLWRYHGLMTPELVELEHAILAHLTARGVPVKRLVPGRDDRTWYNVDRQLVAVFNWFSGESPNIRNRRDLTAVSNLHASWTLAMEDFDPAIEGWRELAAQWRPRKDWAWSLPTEDLPLVPRRMGFMAAVRDVTEAPAHHQRFLAQVQDTEARLRRWAERADEARLADLPRAMNHGVFLFGLTDWELMVTDGDDFVYEARIADLGRLIYALHDRGMAPQQLRDRVLLAVDTYREHVPLAEEELRALPLYAWGMMLYYDLFHVLLYLGELGSPDRGEGLVAKRTADWARVRDNMERSFEELGEALVS